MSVLSTIKRTGVAVLAATLVAVNVAAPMKARAAATNTTAAAKISFTFDDGLASSYTQAAPTLAKYGLTGTNYVITGCVGMATAPNTCHANTSATYMTWDQILALKNTYGWEIGSHTNSHPYLATSDASDGQPNVLTPAQVDAELSTSKAALAAKGIDAKAIATPYGDWNQAVLAQVAKYYQSHRGFADVGYNTWPNNDYLVVDQQVQAGVTVAQVKAKIDTAIANKQWIVLTLHDIKVNASTNPDDYEYKTADLDAIAAYVKTKVDAGTLKNNNVSDNIVTSDTNLLANGSFNNGIADGWTSTGSSITKDTANNGSYPDATNSIKFVPGTTAARLFAPKVPVSSSTNYMFKNFLNVQSLTSGNVEFYVDEYDASGNWISGQYKKGEASKFVESFNFAYKPTSAAVATASLQVTATANSGITAYLDNVQMFALDATVTPPVPPATNLMPNPEFDSGLGTWTTNDTTNIKADASGNGATTGAINSIKLVSSTTNRHLFSPKIAVATANTYTLASYLKVTALASGEVGFYIDEYDASGNWISGQYKTGIRSVSAGDVTFSYKPTSASVAKASLQVIMVANSGVTAYLDNVRMTQN